MEGTSRCQQCDAPLTGQAVGGLCANCLLKLALEPSAEPLMTADDESGRTGIEPTAPRETAGSRIGRYKLLQEIGEGGFGIVYLADQMEPVKRRVALKVLKPGMDTREVIARFEAERQALALMDHPNIARVFDGGATESGRPYFVMELVKGIPLTKYCDDQQLNTRQRLNLFLDVLAAVQHAHQKGIIHRDLKPSNILVSPHDDRPVIKVIDFGIAKAISLELTDKTLFTAHGRMIGTPQYMSPEQAEINALDVDTRSDIYSLGVVLYELLTGRTPLDAKKLRSAAYAEIQRLIREEEPPKPSTRISSLGAALPDIALHRSTEALKLGKQVRGDLDWIVMKAIEKDRTRRYETANGFAADLRRHLADEPVKASPPSRGYRMRKLLRRNRGKAAALGGIFVSLVTGAYGVVWNWLAADEARERAETQSQTAEKEWHRAEDSLYVAHMLVAKNRFEEGRLGGFRDLLERHRPADGRADLRGWEWYYLNSLLHRDVQKMNAGHEPVWSLDWHPGGKMLAGAGEEGIIFIWDPHTGELKQECRGHTGPIYDVEWNPEGTLLASSGNDGTVRLWATGSSEPVLIYKEATGAVRTLTWAKDGRSLLSGGDDQQVRQMDVSSGRTLVSGGVEGAVVALEFHPREPLFHCATGKLGKRQFHLIAIREGKFVRTHTKDTGDDWTSASWNPNGNLLAAGGNAAEGRNFVISRQGEVSAFPLYHNGPTRGIDWSSDGKIIASCSDDETIQCRRADTGAGCGFIAGHAGPVLSVRWSPDNKLLASAGADGTVRTWEPNQARFPCTSTTYKYWVSGLAWSPDSKRLAVAADMGEPDIYIVDPDNPDSARMLPSREPYLWDVDWSPDGRRIAAVGGAGVTTVWDVDSRKVLGRHEAGGVAVNVHWSPDSRHILVIRRLDWNIEDGNSCMVTILDGTNAEKISDFHVPGVERACWMRDGREIVTCGINGTVDRWDWQKGQSTGRLFQTRERLLCVEWSPDWSKLMVTGRRGREIVLDAAGRIIFDVAGQANEVPGVSWSPDSNRIATASFDGTLKIRHAGSGEEMLHLRAHSKQGFSVAWSPDGRRIATGGYDNTLRIWDAGRGDATSGEGTTAASDLKLNSVPVQIPHDPSKSPPQLILFSDPARPVFPPRPREATAAQIDLTEYYNGSFVTGWFSSNSPASDYNLTSLLPGVVTFGGVSFDVRGVVQVAGVNIQRVNANRFPVMVNGITVGTSAKRLHFIHAARWNVADGVCIGNYAIRYSDESSLTIPIVYGVIIRDWTKPEGESGEMPAAPEVWRDTNRSAKRQGSYIRLFKYTWDNPMPDLEIRSLAFTSEKTDAAPFLIAITAE